MKTLVRKVRAATRRPVDSLPVRDIDRRHYATGQTCRACGSSNVTGGDGSWICHSCGAQWQE